MAKASGNKRRSHRQRQKVPDHLLTWANSQLGCIPADISAWGSVATNAYLMLHAALMSQTRRHAPARTAVAVLHIRMSQVRTDASKAAALLFAHPMTLAQQSISTAKANGHLAPSTLDGLRALDLDKPTIETILKGSLL